MANYHIDPHKRLAPEVEILENALLVPLEFDFQGQQTAVGGVFRADGSFVESSLSFIEPHRLINREPKFWDKNAVEQRGGTWLFGGKHDLRFGHFLVETTSRLWAIDHVEMSVDGVVFLPERVPVGFKPKRRLKRTRPMLDLFSAPPACQILVHPVRFERLIVPPQACGAGLLAPGAPEFREFVRGRLSAEHLSAEQRPTGADKIYISRSRLLKTPGHILFERELEDALAAEGYMIFHPQEHDIETQLSTYQAADKILGCEGSAFHLVAYSAHPSAKIGVVRRRHGQMSSGIVDQLTACIPGGVTGLEAIVSTYHIPGSKQMGNSVLDFPQLATKLRDSGFVSESFQLPDASADALEAEKDRLARQVLEGILAG